jgi:hypothetical protein
MSGVKSSGQVLNKPSSVGKLDPQMTNINFAVPKVDAVIMFEPLGMDIPRELPLGVIHQAIQMKSTDNRCVLSVDGKKLAPGLNEENGDQDVFDHEETESLEVLKKINETELDQVLPSGKILVTKTKGVDSQRLSKLCPTGSKT